MQLYSEGGQRKVAIFAPHPEMSIVHRESPFGMDIPCAMALVSRHL